VAACKETSFLHLIMEAKKRIEYSKQLEPDEIEEIMIEKELEEMIRFILMTMCHHHHHQKKKKKTMTMKN
jgi:hypothetical protein